jgi:hypothetical protein
MRSALGSFFNIDAKTLKQLHGLHFSVLFSLTTLIEIVSDFALLIKGLLSERVIIRQPNCSVPTRNFIGAHVLFINFYRESSLKIL